MLSPCIRQVTHALLTRPPLTFESLGFIKSPFDLHVLSTPPAFILSQDQTLMLKFVSVVKTCWSLTSVYCYFWVGLKDHVLWIFSLEFSRIHVTVQLSMSMSLSQRQLLYLIKLFRVCQELFYFIFSKMFFEAVCCFHNRWYLITITLSCQQLFYFSLSLFCRLLLARSSNTS